jgi:hypothetical protein
MKAMKSGLISLGTQMQYSKELVWKSCDQIVNDVLKSAALNIFRSISLEIRLQN